MDLKETVDLMFSGDYRGRMIAEYQQLKIRHKNLINYLARYKAGDLDPKPKSPYELLYEQADDMQRYLIKLQARAILENIDLFSVEYAPVGTIDPKEYISHETTNAYLVNDENIKPVGKHHGVI